MALNWNKYSKNYTRRNYDSDCSIRINGGDRSSSSSLVFRFYNGSEKKFNNGSEYVLFTTNEEGDRVYFASSDSINGYKLFDTNKSAAQSKTLQRKFSSAAIKVWIPRVGDYNILYDKEEKCYYIDLNRKA